MARTKQTAGVSKGKGTSSKTQSQTSSKKVRIIEPSEEQTATPSVQKSSGQLKSIMKKDKGKTPMSSSSVPQPPSTQGSDSDTESISPGKLISSMKRKRSKIASGPGESSKKGSRKVPHKLTPPPEYNNSTLYIVNPNEFELKYETRALCPAIFVKLESIKALGFDVIEYLDYYRKFIEINKPYSPEMVRIFYNNMRSDSILNDKGEVVQQSMVTTIRGVDIHITTENLNIFLGTPEPVGPVKTHTNAQIYELLRPGEVFPGKLSFDPPSMPVLQRIIHYIYSRCLVNKSKNYTHFSHADYLNMALIMDKEKINIGQFIFNEMWRFRISKSKRMTIPYPCLVSHILDLHKVWYIVDKEEKPLEFSEQHLHRMNIDVLGAQPKPPKQKRRSTSATSQGQDEAQSSAPRDTSGPSFAEASIHHFLGSEFQKWGVAFTEAFKSECKDYMNQCLTAAAEYFSGRSLDTAVTSLSRDLVTFKDTVVEKLDGIQSSVERLDDRVLSIEQYIREHQASSSVPATHAPEAEPTTEPTPVSETVVPGPTPSAEPVADPAPEPSTEAPHSPEDPPSEAVLAMIDFSSSILNPDPQPIIVPPLATLPPSVPTSDQPIHLSDSSSDPVSSPQSPLV